MIEEKPKLQAKWKIKMSKSLDSASVSIFMSIITVYSLFFDDIRALTMPVEADIYVYSFTCAVMVAFIIELIIASVVVENYFLSFFFWLDVISTLSMVPDIGFIWDQLTGGNSGASDAGSLAKTSRASRITRVIRVIRLIRLIRIVKLYK